MKKVRNNFWFKTYIKLPLWGKILLPAAAILLTLSAVKMMKTVFYIGVLAGIAYLVASAWFYWKDKEA